MDANKLFTQVRRYFSLQETSLEGKEGQVFHYLHMYSVVEGDFGNVTLSTAALIDSDDMRLNCSFVSSSAQSQDVLFSMRSGELSYFLQVLSMFNPLNNSMYEVQKQKAPLAPEF